MEPLFIDHQHSQWRPICLLYLQTQCSQRRLINGVVVFLNTLNRMRTVTCQTMNANGPKPDFRTTHTVIFGRVRAGSFSLRAARAP